MKAVARRAKRGFNLIEAAIVLSVVGLVIGGIWGVASKIREDLQVQKVAGDINLSVSKATELFRGLPVPEGSFYMKLTPDSKQIDTTKYWPPLPWNSPRPNTYQTIIISSYNNPKSIRFFVDYPRKSICIKLAKAVVTSDGVARNIHSFVIDNVTGGDGYVYNGAVNSPQHAYSLAQTHCQDEGYMWFWFYL